MPEAMTEARFVELYKTFRVGLRDAVRLELAPYPRPFAGGSFNLLAMPFHEVAQDALRELANGINEFRGYIRSLDAWRPIYDGLSENEQHEMLIEHVRPLAVLCLGAPYALRGRMIYSACAASYHSGHFVDWPEGRPEWRGEHSSWTKAERLAKRWNAWPALGQALTALNGEAFNAFTSDYRNNHQHGQPRAIAIGHVAAIKRLPGERNSWSFGHYEPLAIDTLIAPLVEEHRRSLVAFRAFLALIEEQHEAEPGPSPPDGEG